MGRWPNNEQRTRDSVEDAIAALVGAQLMLDTIELRLSAFRHSPSDTILRGIARDLKLILDDIDRSKTYLADELQDLSNQVKKRASA